MNQRLNREKITGSEATFGAAFDVVKILMLVFKNVRYNCICNIHLKSFHFNCFFIKNCLVKGKKARLNNVFWKHKIQIVHVRWHPASYGNTSSRGSLLVHSDFQSAYNMNCGAAGAM